MSYITKNIKCFKDNWDEAQGNIYTMCIDGNDSNLDIELAIMYRNGDYKYDIYAHEIDRNEGGIGSLTIEWLYSDLIGAYNDRKAEYEQELKMQHEEYERSVRPA